MWLEWCIYTCKGNYTSCSISRGEGKNNSKITFKNSAPVTDCISANIQADIVKDIDIVMLMYNLI